MRHVRASRAGLVCFLWVSVGAKLGQNRSQSVFKYTLVPFIRSLEIHEYVFENNRHKNRAGIVSPPHIRPPLLRHHGRPAIFAIEVQIVDSCGCKYRLAIA